MPFSQLYLPGCRKQAVTTDAQLYGHRMNYVLEILCALSFVPRMTITLGQTRFSIACTDVAMQNYTV